MNKIQRISHYFCTLTAISIVILPLLLILFWINAPDSFSWGKSVGLSLSFLTKGLHIMHKITLGDRIAGFAITAIPVAITMSILYLLIHLFQLFQQGKIFTLENIACIKKISYLILMKQAINLIYQPLLTFAMTWHNPHGHRYISITLDQTNIAMVVVGLVILLVAWIMEEGRLLKKDSLSIV